MNTLMTEMAKYRQPLYYNHLPRDMCHSHLFHILLVRGCGTFLLPVAMYKYCNLLLRVASFLDKCYAHWHLYFTIMSRNLRMLSFFSNSIFLQQYNAYPTTTPRSFTAISILLQYPKSLPCYQTPWRKISLHHTLSLASIKFNRKICLHHQTPQTA
jgi:hypothetical protein